MTRHRTLFGMLAVTLALCAWPAPSFAYEEQASLDVATGGVLLADTPALPSYGLSVDVGASRGISDNFVLRGALGYASLIEDGATKHAGRARVEFAYLVDILRWVPSFGLGASVWLYDDEGFAVRPAGHAVFALDFLFNRAWTFGLDLRTGFLWDGDGFVSESEAQLRISRMFDLF